MAKSKSTTVMKKEKVTSAKTQETKIIESAMALAAVQGWNDTTMADIADHSNVSMVKLCKIYNSKNSILAGLIRTSDEQVLCSIDADIVNEPIRDRLFEVIMHRLDVLRPYRDGLAAVFKDMRRNPSTLAYIIAGPGRRSLRWTLEAANIPPWGLFGSIQLKGLAIIYISVLRVWLRDDGEDLEQTMAALDKALARAESVLNSLRRGPARFREDDAQTREEAENDRN